MNRRTLLLQLLGIAAASSIKPVLAQRRGPGALGAGLAQPQPPAPPLPFQPLQGPIPLAADGLSGAQQLQRYGRIELQDRLVVPRGYRSELLLSWGDRLGDGRFGFNNDYLAFQLLGEDRTADAAGAQDKRAPLNQRALLTINFEYISAIPWCAGYREVIGESLPFDELKTALASRGGSVDLAALPAADPLRGPLLAVAQAAMADLGIGVAEIFRDGDGDGRWRHQPGRFDRRITGITGWGRPDQQLRTSGPAAAVFRRRQRLGYDDGLGDRVIGSFANCAGGQTPWGTVLSAEENIHTHVVEQVYADGSSPLPAERPFRFDGQRLEGLGNPFGLAGNKYGWMVELDPRQPAQPAVKHSWLGRFRHEAVAVRARPGEPLVVYSGCDRHGGHLFRYVSESLIRDPADPRNSRLLEAGRLEAAQFHADGSGRWIPLSPDTPLAPLPPSHYERHGIAQACRLPHGDRSRAGAEALADDRQLAAYLQRYRNLADLYPGQGAEQMGAILIDAHLAANAVGATPTARPEDTELDPLSGDLLISFTAAGADGEDRPDPAIFRGPAGQTSWPYGWLMRLQDSHARQRVGSGEQSGGDFRWRLVASGGAPWQGGMGFANPDNLAIDRGGNIWMVTDRIGNLDLFGNNSCWLLPASGPAAGSALLFATAPMESEMCGPCFDGDERTLFLAIQHPGEEYGVHQQGKQEYQAHELRNRAGQPFQQLRRVPLGSNWPSTIPGRAPRPGVVAIYRNNGEPLLGKG
jgi:secreted PhoX family phosphatase